MSHSPATDQPAGAEPNASAAVRSLRIAGALTLVTALLLLVVAVGTLAQGHGTFSVGVGAMLVLYSLLVGALGLFALRGALALTGMVIAAAVLHLLVVGSTAVNDAAWMWWTTPVLLATLVAGIHARVVDSRG
ncbi:hypothetical protein [Aestuariimicrobium ganziense]|uniref:hypothetical protein n=1 Tax=Aestuariimicrobium ganziense TaxID=2773677 RepID=UPI0019408CA3|nr:hypothetical protein [Aestuariimicrobium ganziense]